MEKKYLYLMLCLFISYKVAGQQAKVEVISRPYADSVALRWAPTNPLTWEYGQKYGYVVERHTILKNGKAVEKPERSILTAKPLLAKPLDDWSTLRENKYAMVAAQALYGETFVIEGTGSFDLMSVYQKSKESELRFSLALSAADFSPIVAKFSGLAFTDTKVLPNDKYLYKVYVALPLSEGYKIDTGLVYVGAKDHKPLPKPHNFEVEFSDRLATLSWNYNLFTKEYIGYWLERSSDGITFNRVHENPIVLTLADDSYEPENMVKRDSLPANNKTYYYRVRGISPFGEEGPPSVVLSGKGYGRIKNTPHIVEKSSVDNETILLRWEYPFTDSLNIAHYDVQRATREGGVYETIAEKIPSETRYFTDKRPLQTNYYKVRAFDLAGGSVASMPVMLQLIDSLPPQAPASLTGKMDTTGLVLIRWEASPDKDVLGYRVYRGNSREEEFSQITSRPVSRLEFIDTISTRNLNAKVYYKVMAIDLRQNHSELSEVLTVDKPDLIPPVSPVFKSFASTEEGISLAWHNSPSADVSNHLLYRSPAEQNKWVLLAAFSAAEGVNTYTDKATEIGKEYQYTLLAIDHSKLESKPATPVQVSRIDKGVRPKIEKFYGHADLRKRKVYLSWDYKEKGVEQYVLYKSTDGNNFAKIATISPAQHRYEEQMEKKSKGSHYRLTAIFKSGALAKSNVLSVGSKSN